MNGQGSLFTEHVSRSTGLTTIRPVARNADDASSHEAAAALVASGAHDTQCRQVLAALQAREQLGRSSTSAELAQWMGTMDRVAVARRLPDLLEAGFVSKNGTRHCGVARTLATVWATTPMGRRALMLGLPVGKPRDARRRVQG